jgi:seryl-tRNA synthetase
MTRDARDEGREALLAISIRQDAPRIEKEQVAARKQLRASPVAIRLRTAIKPLQERLKPLNALRKSLLDEIKPLKDELKKFNADMKAMIKDSDERIQAQYTENRNAASESDTLAISIALKEAQ